MNVMPKGQQRATVSFWRSIALCAVSFLLGRSSVSQPALLAPRKNEIPPCIAVAVSAPANDGNATTNNNATASNVKNDTLKTAAAEDPPVHTNTKNSQPEVGITLFDESWISNPNLVMKTINQMCKLIMDHNTDKSRNIGIGTIIFCHTHVLTYKRDYDYTWDSIDSNRTSIDYYVGKDLPPYQMDMLQYLSILTTVASIPQKSIKHELESRGSGFQDKLGNYRRQPKKKDQGPRVLFWGCGSDTPLHAHLVEYLGGTITFIDNSPEFRKICQQWHSDIRLIEPTGDRKNHTALFLSKSIPMDGSLMETDQVNDTLTSSQWMPFLDNIEKETEPWDVIVIDGPSEILGRSQPLYMAKRLAQSYKANHYTHIFLHDASRHDNCVVANAIMGHDPGVYLGNTLPRKGLKHWRVEGRERGLPPTIGSRDNSGGG